MRRICFVMVSALPMCFLGAFCSGLDNDGNAWNFMDFHGLDFFQQHKKLKTAPYVQEMIPLPQSIIYPINRYGNDDTIYDPKVHLNLSIPDYISTMESFKHHSIHDVKRVKNEKSAFGYTAPFQLLSENGVRKVHAEIKKYESIAEKNERNLELRVTCPVFLGQLEKLTGEPVVPHFQLMNAAAANFGSINDPNSKVVDHWHFDSVAFVAVTLVSDITDMQGGELQLLTLDKKAGLSLLKKQSDNRNNTHSRFLNNATTEEDQCEDVDVEAVLLNNTVTVPYEQSGACILIQGSEVLHRVTRVLAARENRISLVMSLQPANVFHPDKTIFHTWDSIFDKALGTAPFEYFRMQAYTASNILKSYVERVSFEECQRSTMAGLLRSVGQELIRGADLIEGKTNDKIHYHREQ